MDLPDADGNTPLHLAEEMGMYSKVKVLLKLGAGWYILYILASLIDNTHTDPRKKNSKEKRFIHVVAAASDVTGVELQSMLTAIRESQRWSV